MVLGGFDWVLVGFGGFWWVLVGFGGWWVLRGFGRGLGVFGQGLEGLGSGPRPETFRELSFFFFLRGFQVMVLKWSFKV